MAADINLIAKVTWEAIRAMQLAVGSTVTRSPWDELHRTRQDAWTRSVKSSLGRMDEIDVEADTTRDVERTVYCTVLKAMATPDDQPPIESIYGLKVMGPPLPE